MGNKIISFLLLLVFLAMTAIVSNASEASDKNQANLENLTEQENIMAVRQAYVDFSKGGRLISPG